MAEALIVNIAELRSAVARVVDATEDRLGTELTLAGDSYWHLPVTDAFDLASEPTAFTVGRLSDDLETLREAGDAPSEPAWHALSHLVGVLRALELAARP
jgi:hypothetical protein